MTDSQTGTTPPPRRRITIRQQVVGRLTALILLLAAGISFIGYSSFHSRQQREIEQKRDVTRAYYAELLPRLEATWQTQAEQTRGRIEFTRIIEEPEAIRWPKLNSFLTAQWEFMEFSNIMILSGKGTILYRFGPEVHDLAELPETLRSGWHHAREQGEFYRVITVPLWLGKSGQGTLVLFRSINTSTLRSLLSPEVQLHLHAAGGILASSHPETATAIEPNRVGLVRTGKGDAIQVPLRWPHASPLAPTLVVHRAFIDSFSLAEFMMRPLMAVSLVLLMLWFGLGRWLTRSVRRIESLDDAAIAYAGNADAEAATPKLGPAGSDNDEIGDVASALQTLMQRVGEREREQRAYLDTLAMLEEAVLELDGDGRILRASPGWKRLTRREQPASGTALVEFTHEDDRPVIEAVCLSFRRREKSGATVRLRITDTKGGDKWAECRLIAQIGHDERLTGIRGVIRDITQTYLHEQQISHMALHDALTDLPNRVLLEDRIKIATRMASRGRHKVAVCFIDLDHFKKINDTLGHKAGDRLLVGFATQLKTQLRAGDTLARWGGDEFVLLLPGLESEADAREVSHKVEQAATAPMRIDDTDYAVTFSMGVALYPDDAEDVDSLLSHADRTMFYAKTQGRNQTCFFGEVADKEGGRKELYIQNKLVEAVAAGRIQAWFQPIIAARSGDCTLVEVLARWHDAEYGWVSPATFIPIAESTGVIRDLGRLIWLQSLEALTAWRARGLGTRLAVNISKRQLFSSRVVEQLVEDLALAGLSPADIVLEVTESLALLDVTNASERLADLHRIGFGIAIDDFGTGYSALSQLHEMPVDELKIDISFVRRLHEPAGASMVQAIIQLARALGMGTVAEGVEDEVTASRLRTLGADHLQGFHFAMPMPRAEIDAWLFGRHP